MASLLVRGCVFGDTGETGDLLVEGGRITARGPGLEAPIDEELVDIDAAGLTALPGAIDALAQLAAPRGPGAAADDLGSGTIAAARGGVTTVVAPVVPGLTETLDVAFHDAERRASGNVLIDYAFAVGLGRPTTETPERMQGVGFHRGFAGAFLDLDAVDQAAVAGPGAILRLAAVSDVPITVRAAGRLGVEAERVRVETLSSLEIGRAHV